MAHEHLLALGVSDLRCKQEGEKHPPFEGQAIARVTNTERTLHHKLRNGVLLHACYYVCGAADRTCIGVRALLRNRTKSAFSRIQASR